MCLLFGLLQLNVRQFHRTILQQQIQRILDILCVQNVHLILIPQKQHELKLCGICELDNVLHHLLLVL